MSNGDKIEEFKKFNKKILDKIKKESESDDFQDMVQNKLKAGMGELFRTSPEKLMKGFKPKKMMRKPFDLPPLKRGELGTKPVLDTKGKPVENLRQKATNKMSGGLQDVDVIDLTTEMVIDE